MAKRAQSGPHAGTQEERDERDMRTLMLYVDTGLKVSEIATRLGVSRWTVRDSINRARRMLGYTGGLNEKAK